MHYDSLAMARSVNTRISIYIYIYIHIDTPTNTITNTNTGIDHLLNAQANTSINADITLFYSLKRICLINIGINTPTHINNHLRIDIRVY